MPRKARPEEAETLWHVRNEAMRHGCKICYDAEGIACWTHIYICLHKYTFFTLSNVRYFFSTKCKTKLNGDDLSRI